MVSEVKVKKSQIKQTRKKKPDRHSLSSLSKRKNGSGQNMTQVVNKAEIEAAKAAVIAIIEADNQVNNARPKHKTPRSGGPVLRLQMFDWKAKDKYQELHNFKTEVQNIFMTNNYNIQGSERVTIILSWICWEGLRFVGTLK